MIQLASKNICTGCGACANICPKKSISMVKDDAGFLYPEVDTNTCIECGRCKSVCHLNKVDKNNRQKAYFGWHKDPQIRASSSSGGAFTALAQTVFQRGGVVYGHVLEKDSFRVHCVRAENEERLAEMRQSKYVESDITEVFNSIKQDVVERLVLFCGTPCQCAALNRLFFGINNLLLISFVCHGVGSPSLFSEHYMSVCGNKHIKGFNMRDKTYGWHDNAIRISFYDRNRDYLSHYSNDTYYYGFISLNKYLRDCCYSCEYTDKHMSDITIADYWNVVNTTHQDDNKGISLIISNTERGTNIIDSLDNMQISPINVSDSDYAFYEGQECNSPYVLNKINEKNAFIESAQKNGFEVAAKTYMNHMVLRRAKTAVKRIKRFLS